jgi:hypothetical protein
MSSERQQFSRARRFAAELRCRYRETGTRVWYEGLTANISVSGVLFRAEHVLQPETEIEMVVTLPAILPGVNAPEIRCRGLIVRKQSGTAVENTPLLAASIARCRVVRGSRA